MKTRAWALMMRGERGAAPSMEASGRKDLVIYAGKVLSEFSKSFKGICEWKTVLAATFFKICR